MGEHTSAEDFEKTRDMVPEGAMQTAHVRIVGWLDEDGDEVFAVNISRDTRYSDILGLLSAAQAFVNVELVMQNEGGG